MQSIKSLLEEIENNSTSTRDKGDRFEKLIQFALKNDESIAGNFLEVWTWMEFPYRDNKPDTGIDLVALDQDKNYIAIQCKFYKNEITKSCLDSFFTTSGKSFKTPDGTKRYSRRIIASNNLNWSKHALDALENQSIPVTRIGIRELEESSILDWSLETSKTKHKDKKSLRPHQQEALTAVITGFKKNDRGKLIMACGTGKTYTALKIAEKIISTNSKILVLVPSIALVDQTIREWTRERDKKVKYHIICSDKNTGRNVTDDISLYDLPFPATTDSNTLRRNIEDGNHIVFSTYQSIDVIVSTQAKGLSEFDLVICDEAHRTTGARRKNDKDSDFTVVHDQAKLKAKKRLYMTATPKFFSESFKKKADSILAPYWSMDDESIFGPKFYELKFSDAIEKNLLSDYKVLIFAVNENYLKDSYVEREDGEYKLDDYYKIIGCWNALRKKGVILDGQNIIPMQRVVAFCNTIDKSKIITERFSLAIEQYTSKNNIEGELECKLDHIDGKMNMDIRAKKMAWLKEDPGENKCRILCNARCLSEGVDVPTLDAVMFMDPRNSEIDIVQSVGRVMRKAPGKDYGYIILPIPIADNVNPDEALNDNKKYAIVWSILQALRSHDNRFEHIVSTYKLNKHKNPKEDLSKLVQVIGVGFNGSYDAENTHADLNISTSFQFSNLEKAIYAKLVDKCGNRIYWDEWIDKVILEINKQRDNLKKIFKKPTAKQQEELSHFLHDLHKSINSSIDEVDAIDILAQHFITEPIFSALFKDYDFINNNPVTKALNKVLENLDLKNNILNLQDFYKAIRERAERINDLEEKQNLIKDLYNKLFYKAFPKLSDRLGIVFTPIEIVDFMIHSVEYLLKKEFNKSLSTEGLIIEDPFTGTGTFPVRLIQSELLKYNDLQRKYSKEIFASEIIPLAYYIATINIEDALHYQLKGLVDYTPFNGAILTDTFQTEQNRTEQNRTEQNRTEQNRTEQNRTEQNRTEQNRTEQNRTVFYTSMMLELQR